MRSPRWQSGWLVEADGEPFGNFELVSAPSPFGGLSHWWRDVRGVDGLWHGPGKIAFDRSLEFPSLVLDTWGNLNVAAIDGNGDELVHFWRNPFGWQGPVRVGHARDLGQFGPPALIQGRFGDPGNFEIVVPTPAGLRHFWRGPDVEFWNTGGIIVPTMPGNPWTGVALLHSRYFENFEVVATTASGELWFTWGFGADWAVPERIGAGSGRPGFTQGTIGQRGNFEVVVPLPDGGLAHHSRDNDAPALRWELAGTLRGAEGARYEEASVFHRPSDGRLYVAARRPGNHVDIYWREPHPPERWHGPCDTLRLPERL